MTRDYELVEQSSSYLETAFFIKSAHIMWRDLSEIEAVKEE